jgi:hypothetical protein
MSDVDAKSAWESYCAALAEAGRIFDVAGDRLDDIDHAEALRFLSRLGRMAMRGLEAPADLQRPVQAPMGPPDITFGIPNPDNLYRSAAIDGNRTYRIRGRRNSIHFLSIAAQAPGWVAATPGSRRHLDGTDLVTDADGSFEIILSAEEHDGNWIQLAPEVRSIMVRQTYLDRGKETAADLELECLDPDPVQPREPMVLASTAERLIAAAAVVDQMASFWWDWSTDFTNHGALNTFWMHDEAKHLAIGGDPQVRTPLMRWRIAEDEALVIDLRPPPCDYWNIQICNIWSEPIDPRTGRTDLNASSATATGDGEFRVIVSDADPGVPNWLDTAGHRQGLVSVRWVRAAELPLPSTEVVPISSIG